MFLFFLTKNTCSDNLFLERLFLKEKIMNEYYSKLKSGKNTYRYARRLNFKRLFLLLTIIITSIFTIYFAKSFKYERKIKYETVSELQIRSGDTLWDIATQYKAEGEDTRFFIYEIKKLNNLTGNVSKVGQVLYIPVKK